jgi:hypothetical protein
MFVFFFSSLLFSFVFWFPSLFGFASLHNITSCTDNSNSEGGFVRRIFQMKLNF